MSHASSAGRIEILAKEVEIKLRDRFAEIDEVSTVNTRRVMSAFHEFAVSAACFSGSSGYGYDDKGRDTFEKIFARVFGTQSALVRLGLVNGTHAITTALFAATAPGTTLLSVTGAPYDTIRSAIGTQGDYPGSLIYYGTKYAQLALTDEGLPDFPAIEKAAGDENVSCVFIQRSRGYCDRPALSVAQIGQMVESVRRINPKANILVDNCYGEFTEVLEPTHVGADLVAGSLIKNPGGGLAPTGGYVAGRKDLVDKAAYRLTSPGIGGECGSYEGGYRSLYQGFFTAPHVTAQALKTAVFSAALFGELGFKTAPGVDDPRSDIIQIIELGSPERLRRFCRGIQKGTPVDSFATPEPWPMPGYDCDVIMAAGSFVQGASIELSADGPMKEPYRAYLQGGITYESGKIGIMMAAHEMMD